MPSLTAHDIVRNALDLYARRRQDRTEVAGGYAQAVAFELEELAHATPGREQAEEFGDVMLNVLLLGASLGIRHPLRCAQMSIDKVVSRMDYIYERAQTRPGEPGHREEFQRLWDECKAVRTNGRDESISSTDPSVVA